MSFRLSLGEFKKRHIYESILIKIYVNANIMNTKYFIKLIMTSTVIEGHFYFHFNLNLVLMDKFLSLFSYKLV